MTFDIVTIFPAMFEQPLAAGVIGRAIESRVLDVKVRDLRDFTTDRHRVVDDVPFSGGLLDFPHYTRPATLTRPGPHGPADMSVPDVLLSGNHADIRRWRKREAVTRTLERRPDLLADAALDDEEREILREIVAGRQKS